MDKPIEITQGEAPGKQAITGDVIFSGLTEAELSQIKAGVFDCTDTSEDGFGEDTYISQIDAGNFAQPLLVGERVIAIWLYTAEAGFPPSLLNNVDYFESVITQEGQILQKEAAGDLSTANHKISVWTLPAL